MRHAAAIATILVAFTAWASTVGDFDQPTGLDAMQYLGNARAWRDGDWVDWHPWRWPLHALLVRLGPFIPTAHVVSLVSVVALMAGTAWAAWRHHGPSAAVQATVLLLAFPDLVVFARTTSPYPLVAALLVLSSLRGRWQPLALALLAAADPRGVVYGLVLLVPVAWDRSWPELARSALGLAAGALSVLALPAELTPLWDQARLQERAAPAVVSRVWERVFLFASPALFGLLLVAPFGLSRANAGRALLVFGTLISGLFVYTPHRYLFPFWALLVLLTVGGLQKIAWPSVRWITVLAAFISWNLHPFKQRDRPMVPGSVTLALRDLEVGADEAVVECGRFFLAVRLPEDIEIRGCDRHLRDGGPGLWLITRQRSHSERWTVVGRYGASKRTILLLYEPRSSQ